MLRKLARFLPFVLLLMLAGSATAAEKRVALVIGNSAYKHAPELANPRNDATDMAGMLKSLGLTVIEGIDLDKQGIDRVVRDFAAVLSGADVGVFYYAGHGLQVNGNNYLVPIDAQLSTVAALEFEMVRLDLVQRIMEAETKTNILFLDACRNNPLARNLARAMGTRSASIGRGLAPVESGIGTLISFSTQPGNVALDGSGRNSPYTGPLVKALGQQGEDIISILTAVRNDVLAATADKQIPWENHALRSRFYFKPQATAIVAPPLPPSPVATSPSRAVEINPAEAERAWSASKDTNDPRVLESFLRRFGESFYGDLARSRLSDINRTFAAGKDSNRALVDANRDIELDPRSSVAYRNRGKVQFDKKDFDRAIMDYNAAVELDPKAAMAYQNRGDAYVEKRYYDMAIADYNRALAINPKSVLFLASRGIAYANKNEFDLAIADYNACIEIAPRDRNIYVHRGNAYMDKNDYDRAIADFTKAIEIDPKNHSAHNGRGVSHARKKEFSEALIHHTKAIELNPKFASAYSNRGWAYEHLKEIDKAVAEYSKALEIDANHVYAREGLKRLGRAPTAGATP